MPETKLIRDHHLLTRNLKLNGKYISNDGGDEGIAISDLGNVNIRPQGVDVFDFEYDKMKIEDEMLSRDVVAFKESRIRAGAAPRGKHLQSSVQSYIKSHPLTKEGAARTRYLEFRHAKINKLKQKKVKI